VAIRIKNIKGHDYAYDVKTVWDKEAKKYKKQTKYLGTVIDKEAKTYERKRNPKVMEEKLILDYGDAYILSQTAQSCGLYDVFNNVLPKEKDTLWSLIFFKILTDLAFVYAQTWYQGNYVSMLYGNANISSQRISEFLRKLGNEKVVRGFFEEYLNIVAEKECGVIIDSTGLPNEMNSPVSRFGYHGGHGEQETRLIMVVDHKNKTPLYFRYVAGNIVDVSTLKNTVTELGKMGVKSTFALLDAGYYSEGNIKSLYADKIDFLTRMPAGRKLFKQLVVDTAETLEKSENLVIYNGRSLFVKPVETDLFGNKSFAFVVCDLKRKLNETNHYLIEAKEDGLSNDEIDSQLPFKGKFILVSSKELDAAEVLPLYYTRQSAERLFGISKSMLDSLPLRTHSEATMRGLLLLNFMALVLFTQLQKTIGAFCTIEEAMVEAKNLKCKVYDDGIIVAEPNSTTTPNYPITVRHVIIINGDDYANNQNTLQSRVIEEMGSGRNIPNKD
jgi:transposase